jgi:preprotein translocase subunit SecB
MAEEAKAPAAEGVEPEFGIQRIYLRDLSFEAPKSPQVFLEEWKPEMDMDLQTKTNSLGDDVHEVILTVTVNVKLSDEVVFIIEVQEAGIFSIKNFPEDQLRPMLGSFCPNVLYPYAREVVTDTVVRGGFPQLYLSPVNFDALFQQHEAEQKASATEAEGEKV